LIINKKHKANKQQQDFSLEKQKLDQLHEREMLKLQIEADVAKSKIENQQEKDYLKSAGDQARLNDTRNRDMANLKLKLAELFSKIREGNKASAQKLLEMMTDTKNERHKIITQLVDTFVKAKATKENKKAGEKKKNESSNRGK